MKSQPRSIPAALGLAAALLLALAPALAAPAAAPKPAVTDPLTLLPGAPDGVLSVNFVALRSSDVLTGIERQITDLPEGRDVYSNLIADIGIDPRSDLDAVLLARKPASGSSKPATTVIASGRFGASDVIQKLAAKGGRVAEHSGTRVWINREGTEGASTETAVALPIDTLLVAGPPAEVERVIDVVFGKVPPEKRDEGVARTISSFNRASPPVWAFLNSTSLAGEISNNLSKAEPTWSPGPLANKVKQVRLMGFASRSLDLRIQADAIDAATAIDLRDAINGALAMAKLQSSEVSTEMLAVLRSARTSATDTLVEFTVAIPSTVFREGK